MDEEGNKLRGIEATDLLQPADALSEEKDEEGNKLKGIEATDLLQPAVDLAEEMDEGGKQAGVHRGY
jgi:hypothetical protein